MAHQNIVVEARMRDLSVPSTGSDLDKLAKKMDAAQPTAYFRIGSDNLLNMAQAHLAYLYKLKDNSIEGNLKAMATPHRIGHEYNSTTGKWESTSAVGLVYPRR